MARSLTRPWLSANRASQTWLYQKKIRAREKHPRSFHIHHSLAYFRTRLLNRSASVGAARPTGIVANHACRVGTKHALAGNTKRNWSSSKRVPNRRRIPVSGENKAITSFRSAAEDRIE